jgi:thiamine-monophosphate kinase
LIFLFIFEGWREDLPLSTAAAHQRGAVEAAMTGGDDYELLFTAHPEQRPAIQAIAHQLDLALTPIGSVIEEQALHLLDGNGRPVPLPGGGWQHF